MKLIDKAYRIVSIMGVPSKEKVELVAYQLKCMDKVLYDLCIEERGEEVRQIAWEEFKGTFIDQFFMLDL